MTANSASPSMADLGDKPNSTVSDPGSDGQVSDGDSGSDGWLSEGKFGLDQGMIVFDGDPCLSDSGRGDQEGG